MLNSSQIKRIREWFSNEIFLLIRNFRKQEVGWVKVRSRGWKPFLISLQIAGCHGKLSLRRAGYRRGRVHIGQFSLFLGQERLDHNPRPAKPGDGVWGQNGKAVITTGPRCVEVNEGIPPAKKRNCVCVRTRAVATDAKTEEPRPDSALVSFLVGTSEGFWNRDVYAKIEQKVDIL